MHLIKHLSMHRRHSIEHRQSRIHQNFHLSNIDPITTAFMWMIDHHHIFHWKNLLQLRDKDEIIRSTRYLYCCERKFDLLQSFPMQKSSMGHRSDLPCFISSKKKKKRM